jgi:predicted ATPase
MVKINKIVETTARLMINGEIVGEFNSLLQLNDIRIQIKIGEYKGYSILWEDRNILIYVDGTLSEWPPGFFDIFDKQLDEILGL